MSKTTSKVRFYETICLTKVDTPQEKYTALVDRCKKAVAENGKGEWLYEDDWGKAKIAYPVEKEPRAQWTYFRYKSEPAGVDELVRTLGINEYVLRQVTSRTSEDGADYNTLRPTFTKDLNDRDKPREWKDPRRGRGRDRGEGGGYGGGRYNNDDRGDRGPDRAGPGGPDHRAGGEPRSFQNPAPSAPHASAPAAKDDRAPTTGGSAGETSGKGE